MTKSVKSLGGIGEGGETGVKLPDYVNIKTRRGSPGNSSSRVVSPKKTPGVERKLNCARRTQVQDDL